MLPKDFVYLDETVPGVKWDAKYAGCDNFVGRPIDGYHVNRIVIHSSLIEPLKKARDAFACMGLVMLVYDAYRPQRAVRDFMNWMKDSENQARKSIHYPNIDKKDMAFLGYVAEKSGHSRGCTIDLTLEKDSRPLDMGGIFDLMDERSHTLSRQITKAQTENRLLLRRVMLDSGFTDYSAEWWHFRLKNEAYPDTYFDFPIDGGAEHG